MSHQNSLERLHEYMSYMFNVDVLYKAIHYMINIELKLEWSIITLQSLLL